MKIQQVIQGNLYTRRLKCIGRADREREKWPVMPTLPQNTNLGKTEDFCLNPISRLQTNYIERNYPFPALQESVQTLMSFRPVFLYGLRQCQILENKLTYIYSTVVKWLIVNLKGQQFF
jgi:hypothetical protein